MLKIKADDKAKRAKKSLKGNQGTREIATEPMSEEQMDVLAQCAPKKLGKVVYKAP